MGNWYINDLMEDEVTKEEIKALEGNEERVTTWNVEEDPFSFKYNGYEHVIDELRSYTAERYEYASPEEKEKLVDEVVAIYRNEGSVLPITYFNEEGCIGEVQKCLEYDAKFKGNVVSTGAGVGTALCNFLFPNLFDVPSKQDLTEDKAGGETLVRRFNDDEFLRRAIKFCFTYKDGSPTPSNLMGGLRLTGSAPSNFRPMNAKAIYERFTPPGGTIYDFCCVDGETEYFNGYHWKPIKDYKPGDRVLQYNESGRGEMVSPTEYINEVASEPLSLYEGELYSSCQTGNHDVVIVTEDGELTKMKQSEVDKIEEGVYIPLFKEYLTSVDKKQTVKRGLHTCIKAYVGKPVMVATDRKYCFVVPSHMLVLRRNDRVYVTGNCGFGGRLLGALSSKNNYRYVGTDPNTETMFNLHRLGELIERTTGREDSYELHCCGSEVFKGLPSSIDFAFSSPPYFDLEVYSAEETQCFNKFPVLEDWLEGYVRETVKNIVYMLKPGACYAVNIADFNLKGIGEVAYVDAWKKISAEEGCPWFDTVYLGVTARAGSRLQAEGEMKTEIIMVFKKPM